MRGLRAWGWFDAGFVFVAACGVFVWQWFTPAYRVLKPVRVRPTFRSRRSR